MPPSTKTTKKLGHYTLLSEIGSGGMAVVHRAEQPSLGRLVAIKELRKELASDACIITRFEREAKSVAALAHQNIVHMYDFLTRGDSLYIVMEYVEGIDLYELMTRVDRLPPDIAAIIGLQAARALEYAHYRGVVHRDLKPSNLMITKQGEVKLMDFGIARDEAFDDLTRPGTALGTPAYMSPEQIMGDRVDHRSDIFSFGIVLYQMLTGEKPFVDDDTRSVLQSILHEPYVRPRKLCPDVPRALQRIVKRCLQKRIEKRFQGTEILRAELEAYVSKKIRINCNGRLVIYLRNRDLISDSEAKTYVRMDELCSRMRRQADMGYVNAEDVVFKPLSCLYALVFLFLSSWLGFVHWHDFGNAMGHIQVHALPYADVWVDNQPYGKTPLSEPIALPPGNHALEFRHKLLGSQKIVLDVKEKKIAQVHVEFKKP